jgi:predicted DsbA family dithiol-disulfide isomerase
MLSNIIWRPFELNPDMPKAGLDRKAYRSAKFGSWERSQALMKTSMTVVPTAYG